MIRRPNINKPELKTQQFEFLGRSGDIIHINDTQYSAPQVYASLCHELKAAGVFDLEALAHEMQFVNHRVTKTLQLIAAVDDIKTLFLRMDNMLGIEGIRRLFIQSLMHSLSIFNIGEANVYYTEKSGYKFEIKLVKKWSEEIYRTPVGKVPLVRDIF